MQEMPTIRGRVLRIQPATLPPKRRSTIDGSWPRCAQRRGDVLEPERLDAEERSQPEPLVAGVGAHQQNVHWCSANCKLERPHGRNAGQKRAFPTPLRPAGRKKWVSHGLSNRIVYGGLHYGARWLPMAALNTINLVGNSLAVTFLHAHEGRACATTSAPPSASRRREADELARRQFFEYGRHTIDVWRLRSEAFVPRITTFDEDAARPRARAGAAGADSCS